MVTNELLKKQPIGTRLMNDTCPGFKKCADGAWYPIKKWRPYPMDSDDIDQFTQSDFDYQEANRAF